LGWRPITIQAIALIYLFGCSSQSPRRANQITPTYDDKTGKLTLLQYDSNGNGKIDTWSYMDGARVVRIEIDQDEDGRIDRWEYYDANQKIERVGFSRLGDGKEDAWSFAGPDGSIARIEVSAKRDGRISRIEHYDKGRMTSAEEDTDGDGKMDKWETYDGVRLTMVAYDTQHRGRPDRRLVYAASGAVRVEVDAKGDGVFIAEPAAK
jgi:hypothetical protein